MSFPALSAVVATVARSAGASTHADVTDGELLRTYARSRAEAPFADLVRRLGPMVLGVCRRVAGDQHLADDAFQAAFVVLARRAGDVRPAEAVRAWLYGVAVRTAREARAVSARRLAREVPMPTVPDRAQEPRTEPDVDALAILDEEIANLAEHFRSAVVICEIDGVSRKDAARRLGIAEGTLSSRLAKARKLLAHQLRKRGGALPAALAVLTHAAVSTRLAAQTSALVSPSAPLPPAVAALTNGVLRTMLVHKLTLYTGCAVLFTAAGLALQFTIPEAAAKDPPKPPARLALVTASAVAEPGPAKQDGSGSIVVARHNSAFWVLAPDGKRHADVDVPEMTHPAGGAAISPDGKKIAYVINTEVAPRPVPQDVDEIKPWPFKIIVRPFDKPEGAKEWEMPANHLSLRWTADGKRIIASKITNPRWTEYECVLLDPDTGKTEKLDLPANARVVDCAKDGKTFLVQTYNAAAKKCELGIATLGSKDVTALCDLHDRANRPTDARLSPDGKRILFIDADPARKDAHKWGCSQRVYVIDVQTKKREALADFPENGRAHGVAWSPDGKKIAYTWTPLNEEVLKKDSIGPEDAKQDTEGFLIVADADGKNAKTVATDKGMFVLGMVLGAIDWR
jgi:RNA polymerase sigma factor (sigma-70 family)